jgi:hypothetical protein
VAIIFIQIFISVSIAFSRQSGAQAVITSCGDLLSGGVSMTAQTQLTVDESCSVSGQPSYSSSIGQSLTVPSGAILQLNNVSNTSNSMFVSGTFALQGSLIVVFTNTPGVVNNKAIITYSSGACTAPSGSLLTFQNAPTGVSNYGLVTSVDSSSNCNILLSALYPSPNFTLYLNQPNTFTAAQALQIFQNSGYDTTKILIISIVPGSVVMTFQCLAATTTTAQSFCNTIYSNALNPSNPLYSSLGVLANPATTTTTTTTTTSTTSTTSSTTYVPTFAPVTGGQGSGNNQGLLGLIALVAILPIALIAFWIWKVKTTPEIPYPDAKKDFELPPATAPQPVAPAYAVSQPVPGPYSTLYGAGAPVYASANVPIMYGTPAPTPTPTPAPH